MTAQLQLPDEATAHATIVGIHKQAYFGLLRQLGMGKDFPEPQNAKEAAALLDLGIGLMEEDSGAPVEKAADADGFDYGSGPYAQYLAAFNKVAGNQGAPGFENVGKKASTFGGEDSGSILPPALVDSAYQAAMQLAQDPGVYGAAVVKRAMNETMLFEYCKEAGLIDEEGNPTDELAAQLPANE